MTTSNDIESVWESAVWQDVSIVSTTTNIFTYPVTKESETEAGRYYYNQRINFIEAITVRDELYQETARILGRAITYRFTVTVNYYREIEPDGTSYGLVRDFFETLSTTVRDELGRTWASTVDFYRPQEGPAEISEITLDGRRCWRGTYRFIATFSDTLT